MQRSRIPFTVMAFLFLEHHYQVITKTHSARGLPFQFLEW